MDKTTTWLIRGAAGVFILLGLNYLISPSGNILQKGFSNSGNSCPLGFAYSGNGYCRQVTCVMTGDNNRELAGKDHACGNAPFWSGWIGRMILDWGDSTVKATYDRQCPSKPPSVGWRSSCNEIKGASVEPHYAGGVIPKNRNKKN